MPHPYEARVDVRRFLNFPGFYGGAYVVAYVEDTTNREPPKPVPYRRRRRFPDGETDLRPRIILEIADCDNRINLDLNVHGDYQLENSLHKIDALIDALTRLREGVVAEAVLYRERARERASSP